MAFILQRQAWVIATASVWLVKPKILGLWRPREEVGCPELLRMGYHYGERAFLITFTYVILKNLSGKTIMKCGKKKTTIPVLISTVEQREPL